jgi:hypothetical protein
VKHWIVTALSLTAVIVLAMLLVDVRSEKQQLERQVEKWKTLAENEQEIPTVNNRAKNFVKALNRGKHRSYLTGAALNEYEKALESDEYKWNEDKLEHTSFSEQTLDILLASTERTEDDQIKSVVIYQLLYKSPFDQESIGIVDQRILTFIMNIFWSKSKEGYQVETYKIQLLEDNMGAELSSMMKEGKVQ